MPPTTCCSCEEMRAIVEEALSRIFSEHQSAITGKPKKKRAPSPYNIFIGTCMKEPNKTMKLCAADYKAQKGA